MSDKVVPLFGQRPLPEAEPAPETTSAPAPAAEPAPFVAKMVEYLAAESEAGRIRDALTIAITADGHVNFVLPPSVILNHITWLGALEMAKKTIFDVRAAAEIQGRPQ
jgi:hypothetical protein